MSSRILVAMRVPGSPDRAFRAFTEEVGVWWRGNPMFRFTSAGPGRVAFEPPADGTPGRFVERLPDGETFIVGDVSVWDAGRRLVFGWRQESFTADQHTEVEVIFEPVGAETRVTVQHRGWDSVPQAHVARHTMPAPLFAQRHGEWWRIQLLSLSATQSAK